MKWVLYDTHFIVLLHRWLCIFILSMEKGDETRDVHGFEAAKNFWVNSNRSLARSIMLGHEFKFSK